MFARSELYEYQGPMECSICPFILQVLCYSAPHPDAHRSVSLTSIRNPAAFGATKKIPARTEPFAALVVIASGDPE